MRVGDPPSLGHGPGSSQQHEVTISENETHDECFFPPMHPEALEWFDTMGERHLQSQQLQQQQQQHQDTQQHRGEAPQSLKLDLLTGRVGDPPGLGSCPGSSPKTEVKPENNEILNDHTFPPMSTEDLDWVEAALLDQGDASVTAFASATAASTEDDCQPLEGLDHPGVQLQKRSTEGGPSEDWAHLDSQGESTGSTLGCDRQVAAPSLISTGSRDEDQQQVGMGNTDSAQDGRDSGTCPEGATTQDERQFLSLIVLAHDSLLYHLVVNLEAAKTEKEDDLLNQQECQEQQQRITTEQHTDTSKWDLPTGRSGALPGPDHDLGSGPSTQVDTSKRLVETVTDPTFLPMKLDLDELRWLVEQESNQTDPPGTSNSTLTEAAAIGDSLMSTSMPPPAPRRASAPPPAPTVPSPMPNTPPRPRPMATSVTVEPRPSDLSEDCCCLLRLGNFCPEMRDLAGEGGITPSLLFSRSAEEAKRNVTASSRGWKIGKLWRVREGILASSSLMASGGLASVTKAKSDIWHKDVNAKSAKVVQVDNLLKFESTNSVVQVNHIYNPCNPCDEIVQVDHCINGTQAMNVM